jgi:biotin transport system permease protein
MMSLYGEERSWLHAVPAGVKLLALALAGTALFVTARSDLLAPAALASIALFTSLGRATRGQRRLLPPLLAAILLVTAFHALMGQPWVGIASSLRLVSMVLLGLCVTASTRPTEFLDVIERLLQPLQRFGVRPQELALRVALMLRFIDQFFGLWQRLDDSHRLRTSRPGRLRLLAPLAIQLLLAARRVADALQVRIGK